jgi:hypothetical protein
VEPNLDPAAHMTSCFESQHLARHGLATGQFSLG